MAGMFLPSAQVYMYTVKCTVSETFDLATAGSLGRFITDWCLSEEANVVNISQNQSEPVGCPMCLNAATCLQGKLIKWQQK